MTRKDVCLKQNQQLNHVELVNYIIHHFLHEATKFFLSFLDIKTEIWLQTPQVQCKL